MAYNKDSFLAGLAVGRSLWKPPVKSAEMVDYFAFTIVLNEETGKDYYVYVSSPRVSNVVIWGDGVVSSSYGSQDASHTYDDYGTYQVKIRGNGITRIGLTNTGPKAKAVVSIDTPLPPLVFSIEENFKGLVNLEHITPLLFYKCAPRLRSVKSGFSGCTRLTDISRHLFRGCSALTDLSGCFYDCPNIKEIPQGLFKDCSAATTFDSCFALTSYDQSAIPTVLPDYLFQDCHDAVSFRRCFFYRKLASIPEHTFSGCVSAEDFYSVFYWSGNTITEIPVGLFADTISAKNFDYVFYRFGITDIPDDLFSHCPDADSFASTFAYTGITSIPSNLFASCPNVDSFNGTFQECRSLQSIPSNLFTNCPNVTSFSYAFDDGRAITGAVPALWVSHPNANGTRCFRYCYSASNYNDIPIAWKS